MNTVQGVVPFINDLLTEKPAKDAQSKNQAKYKKFEKFAGTASDTDKVTQKPATKVTGKERRSGGDRRLSKKNRGRWLESRDRNNRRKTDAVFVKI